MCGRADDNFGPRGWRILNDLFGQQGWELESMRDEIRPTDPILFVCRTRGRFEAPTGRWGLVPHGMGLDHAKKLASFNARIKTLHERAMFRAAFQGQRCVVPIAGFWEWPTHGGVKTRVRIPGRTGGPSWSRACGTASRLRTGRWKAAPSSLGRRRRIWWTSTTACRHCC